MMTSVGLQDDVSRFTADNDTQFVRVHNYDVTP